MSSLKYIICTVDSGYDAPLYRLLESMIVNGIKAENILLSIQKATEIYPIISEFNFIIGNSNINLLGVSYYKKIYEYSFFNSCKILVDSGIIDKKDKFFMLHDTCIILYTHKNKISNILSSYNNYDIIFADNVGRHNIGIYSYKAILEGYNIWRHPHEISKLFAIDIEHNRAHVQNYNIKNNTTLKQYRHHAGLNDTGDAFVYNYRHKRTVSSLTFFGIEKYFIYLINGYHPNLA